MACSNTHTNTRRKERRECTVGVNKRTNERTNEENQIEKKSEKEKEKCVALRLRACDAKAEQGTMSVRANRCSSDSLSGGVEPRRGLKRVEKG